MCGMGMMNRKVAQTIYECIHTMSRSFEIEQMLLARKFAYDIKEYMISTEDNSEKKQ